MTAPVDHNISGPGVLWTPWFGSTAPSSSLARWEVLGGGSPRRLKGVTSARRTAFETAIRLRHGDAYVAVRALDARGHVLGTSRAVKG